MDGVRGGLICSRKTGKRGAHFLIRAVSSVGVFAVAALVWFLYTQGARYLYATHYEPWLVGKENAQFPLGALLIGSTWQAAAVLLVWAYSRVVCTDPGAVSAVSGFALNARITYYELIPAICSVWNGYCRKTTSN